MRKFLFLGVCAAIPLMGVETKPGNTPSQIQSSSSSTSLPPTLPPRKVVPLQEPLPPPLPPAPVNVSASSVYTHPGIVVPQDGSWVGSDHLLNVPRNIEVVVEILKPENTTLPFDQEYLQKRVAEAFKKKDLGPNSEIVSNTPGIPFFNLLVVVYPIEKGFVALIDGRLMEAVDPLRVHLEKGTSFQAITWEKKTLIVAPSEDFKETVDKTVDEIVNTFFERFDFFEKFKTKMESREGTQRLQ